MGGFSCWGNSTASPGATSLGAACGRGSPGAVCAVVGKTQARFAGRSDCRAPQAEKLSPKVAEEEWRQNQHKTRFDRWYWSAGYRPHSSSVKNQRFLTPSPRGKALGSTSGGRLWIRCRSYRVGRQDTRPGAFASCGIPRHGNCPNRCRRAGSRTFPRNGPGPP